MVDRSKYLSGLDKVIAKLNTEVSKIEQRTLKGLIRAAIIVRRDMDKVSPKIPVDKGNLRQSFFIISSEGKTEMGTSPGFVGEKPWTMYKAHKKTVMGLADLISPSGPFVQLGFSANYAIEVHEKVGRSGMAKRGLSHMRSGVGDINWSRPGSGPKFLENALDRNILDILYMIGKEAKIR